MSYEPIDRRNLRLSGRLLLWLVVVSALVGGLWWVVAATSPHFGGHHRVVYHGGLVLDQPRIYTIYDDPDPTTTDRRQQARVAQFLQALPASRYLTVIRSYQARATHSDNAALGLASYAPTTQSTVVGACPTTPCQIGSWIAGIAYRHRWPIGAHSIFVIFLPRAEAVKAFSPEVSADTAGYHTAWLEDGEPPLLGIVVGGAGAPVPRGDIDTDQITVLAHELVETITDPISHHGWISTSSACEGASWDDCKDREIADVCEAQSPAGIATTIGRTSYQLPLYAAADGTCQNGSSTAHAAPNSQLDTNTGA